MSSKTSTYFLEAQPKSLQATEAWGSIREHKNEILEAASRLKMTGIDAYEQLDMKPHRARSLSAIERLPEEVMIVIMEHLDHESLYYLSQSTGYFLRLSFDIVFELDPSWRAFRHTVDALNNGPNRRVLDGARQRQHTQTLPSKAEMAADCQSVIRASDFGEIYEIEDKDEGETMLQFMARSC